MELTTKGVETKSRIVKAALYLFSQQGYNGTTTKQIARQSGMAEGTLFRYFPNKKALLHSLLKPLLVEAVPELRTEVENLAFTQAIELIVKRRLKLIEENWPLFKVLFFEAGFQPELRQQITQEVIFPMIKAIEPIFKQRMEQGEIRQMNSYIAMQVLAGILASFIFYNNVIRPENSEYQIEEEHLIKGMLKIFFQGVVVHE
ncbi:MAG: TetR/AcrR family transcriptional regulator [Carboxydocellales bacterium]